MRKFLITLHRWLGFPLGLLFVITFGTGCLTAVEELLERMTHSRDIAHYSWRATTIEDQARVIEQVIQGKKGIRQLQMPTIDTPYYRVTARGESWTYPINYIDDFDQAKEIHTQTANNEFFRTVLQLHRNYLLGKEGLLGFEGKYYTAIIGLSALFLSLLGLYLWWPKRKGFRSKNILPRGSDRRYLLMSHMTSGVIVLAIILILALTGASITYRTFVQQMMGIDRDKAPISQSIPLDNNWQSWLGAAYTTMPENSTLETIRFPRQKRNRERITTNKPPVTTNQPMRNNNSQILEFRFLTEGDWLGLTGSKVKIDKQSSRLIDSALFHHLPINEKIYSILVPLHTGHNLSFLYVIALLILSFIGTVMVFSGLVSFVIKKRQGFKALNWFSFKAAK